MIKAIVIDDEINSRELLHNMLTNHCENVEVLGMAKDVSSGIEIILQKNPQLVFLDIEMPGGNGFDILNALEDINFKVVFVTGYDQYAIKAIKYAALDYILKPVDLDELKSAVEKANSEILNQENKIRFLQENYNDSSRKLDQIIISTHNNHNIINLDDIVYLEAMDGYSIVFVEPNIKHISSHPINQFFRIHKSHLINCNKVTGFDAGRGGNVSLTNKVNLPIATRRKSLFTTFINRLNT